MTDHEVIMELAALIEAATIHFSAMSTFVLLYVVGLYAFLRRAPLLVRLIAYVFFVGSFAIFVVIGAFILRTSNLENAARAEAVAAGELGDAVALSVIPTALDPFLNAAPALWYLLVTATVIGLGWLTFFYRWDADRD